jgi:hypothetical protein
VKIYINLTPHVINVMERVFYPSGTVARCSEVITGWKRIDGIDFVEKVYGNVAGLPSPKKDTIYIVSGMVRLALPKRHDLASPGETLRDGAGHVVGVTNLVVNKGAL